MNTQMSEKLRKYQSKLSQASSQDKRALYREKISFYNNQLNGRSQTGGVGQDEIVAQTSLIASATGSINGIKDFIGGLKAKLIELVAEKKAALGEATDCKTKSEKLVGELNTAQNIAEIHRKELTTLGDTNNSLVAEHKQAIIAKETEIDELKVQITNLDEQLNAANLRVNELESEATTLNTTVINLNEQLTTCKDDATNLASNLDTEFKGLVSGVTALSNAIADVDIDPFVEEKNFQNMINNMLGGNSETVSSIHI